MTSVVCIVVIVVVVVAAANKNCTALQSIKLQEQQHCQKISTLHINCNAHF